ncbi:MAG: hypothetical protein EZS28_011090 [Streblomastix strix]|uniref:Uncharacterized protein n=1 Tax=Streblomastix strix TaxID=222440 RepID=A0A5J4WFI2_9EUKA|nr:MAG: hypothetical protein EZS28_011090 [Streblomastix strix]
MKFVVDCIWRTVTHRNKGDVFILSSDNFIKFCFVLTGCNSDPTDRDGVWKMGSTSSQFRIQKQKDEAYDYKGLIVDFDCTSLKFNNQLVAPLLTPPIEYATQQTLAITHANPNANPNTGYTIFSFMYDQAKPNFSGSSYNIPLNAIMYATKQATTPVVWTNAIPIDCFIDPDGHVKINTQCQYSLPNYFFVQVCDSYALYIQ